MLNEDFFYFFSMKEGKFAGDYVEKLPPINSPIIKNFSVIDGKIDGNYRLKIITQGDGAQSFICR
jgi:hypothetical protein